MVGGKGKRGKRSKRGPVSSSWQLKRQETYRRGGTAMRSAPGMRIRVLRIGRTIAAGSLALSSRGWRRWWWMRQRSSSVSRMLLLLLLLRGLKLAPGLSRKITDVTAGYKLRRTVQMWWRHYCRLLRLTAVSHIFFLLFPRFFFFFLFFFVFSLSTIFFSSSYLFLHST